MFRLSRVSRIRIYAVLIMLLLISDAAITLNAQEATPEAEPYAPVIDPENFVEGIDNPYLTFTPGTTYIYEGESDGELERIEVTVLAETRDILGITCTIVRDTVWVDGELVEDTFDWYAQDVDGNVWYMGEDVKDYENGEVVSTAGSWEAGVDGALPGIVMQADPQVGDTYRQEYYVGEAEDMAEVISLTETASVTYGDFEDVLVTSEWSPLSPGVVEHKYYAQGVGLILEVVVEGGEGQVELLEVVMSDVSATPETESGS
jgi:hypothetical protein